MSAIEKHDGSAYFKTPARNLMLYVSRGKAPGWKNVSLLMGRRREQIVFALCRDNEACSVEQELDGTWRVWLASACFEIRAEDATEIAALLDCSLRPMEAAP